MFAGNQKGMYQGRIDDSIQFETLKKQNLANQYKVVSKKKKRAYSNIKDLTTNPSSSMVNQGSNPNISGVEIDQ